MRLGDDLCDLLRMLRDVAVWCAAGIIGWLCGDLAWWLLWRVADWLAR